jgi:uncharacterized protein YlxW (UPF0749 family)
MGKLGPVRLLLIVGALVMSVFSSAVNAQAPGVEKRSEAKRDRESTNVGKARKAEREHKDRMDSSKKAADEYKSSKKDAAAKDRYQERKKKGGW